MKKIIVIGCPGSGKSRFSKSLSVALKIPVYHLDMMFWNEDKSFVERSVLIKRISEVLKKEEWIIDGNYNSTLDMRFEKCDTVFFLDLPTDVCLDGVRERRGKPRDDMPWIETEEDVEFTEYVKTFNIHSRPKILELIKEYSDKEVFTFITRREVDEYLSGLQKL